MLVVFALVAAGVAGSRIVTVTQTHLPKAKLALSLVFLGLAAVLAVMAL